MKAVNTSYLPTHATSHAIVVEACQGWVPNKYIMSNNNGYYDINKIYDNIILLHTA